MHSWKLILECWMAKTFATTIIVTFFCFNSGTCLDGVNNYSCICNAGFTGRHCNVLITSCSNDTCFPGVPCAENNNSISCGSCPSGFTGDGKNCKGRIENKVVQPSDLIWPMSASHKRPHLRKRPRQLLKVMVGYLKLSPYSPFQHTVWQIFVIEHHCNNLDNTTADNHWRDTVGDWFFGSHRFFELRSSTVKEMFDLLFVTRKVTPTSNLKHNYGCSHTKGSTVDV